MIPAMNFYKVQQPLPDDAPRDYNYKLLDTIAINGRMSYMIYFKNKRKVELQDWKAYYIDKNNFAVSKAYE
jgi:hypothetical protein